MKHAIVRATIKGTIFIRIALSGDNCHDVALRLIDELAEAGLRRDDMMLLDFTGHAGVVNMAYLPELPAAPFPPDCEIVIEWFPPEQYEHQNMRALSEYLKPVEASIAEVLDLIR